MDKKIFCANHQEVTVHECFVPIGGADLICRCRRCGREIHFPTTLSASELRQAIADHRSNNMGQVPSELTDPVDHPMLAILADILDEEAL
jgi:hypothetical protein